MNLDGAVPYPARGPGRPAVGPKLDFRVPAEAEAAVRRATEASGRTADAVCREIFLRGLEVSGLLVVSATPPARRPV